MSSIALLAGVVSTAIFVGSMLPMLVKARRTKDLRSYSVGNIVLSNAGNLVHSVYVFSLPVGPVWWLHSFHLTSTALMLVWYVRYTHLPMRAAARTLGASPDALRPATS